MADESRVGVGREVSIREVPGVRIGQAEYPEGATGCTIVIADQGMTAGVDVRGAGPASRETTLLDPLTSPKPIQAIMLAGGSAFGLDAAGGAMKYLESHGIGYDVGVTKVPLVAQSDLFDLPLGDPFIRPDGELGFAACVASENGGNYQDGCFGAGTGATVGKLGGPERVMKSGIGSYAVKLDGLYVGAVVAVNAVGDVFDWRTGEQLAGVRGDGDQRFISSAQLLYNRVAQPGSLFGQNTTIGVIITNARLSRVQLTKVAGMAHDGMARSIKPVHTSADGDTLYAAAAGGPDGNGTIDANLDAVGTLAADVLSEAISQAVRSATSSFGIPAWRDIA